MRKRRAERVELLVPVKPTQPRRLAVDEQPRPFRPHRPQPERRRNAVESSRVGIGRKDVDADGVEVRGSVAPRPGVWHGLDRQP